MIQAMIALANLLDSGFAAFLSGIAGANPNAVPRDMDVQTYLDEKKMPRWYQKLLFRHHRVSAAVKPPNGDPGLAGPVSDPLLTVPAGSVILTDETQNGQFNRELTEARNKAVDYIFTPDPDPADPFLRGVEDLHRQLKSSVLSGAANAMKLQDFVRLIGRSDDVTTPPRNLIVVSHAHWSGELWFSPTSRMAEMDKMFRYEDIPRISAALKVDDKFLEPPYSATSTPPLLIFTGCTFGQSTPFLKKLRDAINPRLTVVAPKFLYGIRRKDSTIIMEFMSKPYTEYSQTELTRAELIARLKKRKLDDAHGSPIEDTEWEAWVPKEPWTEWSETPNKTTALWTNYVELKLQPIPVRVDAERFKKNRAQCLKDAVATLTNRGHLMSTSHPFPLWERFGFSNANELIDTFKWDDSEFIEEEVGQPNTVKPIGLVYRYELCVMIRDQSPQRLPVCNLHVQQKDGLYKSIEPPGLPLPKFPLSAHGPANTKYWAAIEPSA